MTHIRTRVRNYVLNRLKNKTGAQNRVYPSKVTPNSGLFPVIGVYTLDDERDEDQSQTPYTADRTITLEVQIEVLTNQDYDTALDAECLLIEQLVDYKLGGGIPELESCKYDATKIVFKDDGQKVTAIATMSWDVKYVWEETPLVNPEDLDDLKWIYTKYDLSEPNDGSVVGPDGQIDAEDRVGDLST